eukprot:CAMPEP_0174292620 /NCGR_PEP_ID=MMETSP0809-20121228/36080_1 /TAXON_ID=73025 ORGANISM="Eutreptiella gymnastica-like, Strain CCMP1594" /NCGR_SAMPLE_ID=MMETSP0809 /ASSEMBLY_ACC=CAM_ASM_000658 /LENGTH=38 /DNA_ID= /DNA_START= /DNA_END= /DNA_ORIENTATION=
MTLRRVHVQMSATVGDEGLVVEGCESLTSCFANGPPLW